MFEEVKKLKLKEIEKGLDDLNIEYNILLTAFEENYKKMEAVRETEPEYSWLEKKVTKRKKYKTYLDESLKYEHELYEEREKIKGLRANLAKEEDSLNETKTRITNAFTIEELGFDEDTLEKYCINNNIAMSVKDKATYLKDKYAKTPEGMKVLLDTDPYAIMYDQTNDPEVYAYCLDKLSSRPEFDFTKDSIDYFKGDMPYKEDMKKFTEYMYENVRKTARHFIDNEDKVFVPGIGMGFNVDIERALELYNTEYGKELEKLYNDPNIILGIHATSKTDYENIFRDGLKSSGQDDGAIRALNRTVAYQISFLRMLDYGIGGNSRGKKEGTSLNYIITIPTEVFENEMPIWGALVEHPRVAHKEGWEDYLLPEYIYGCVDLGSKDPRIIKNDLKDIKKYPYLYANYGAEPVSEFEDVKTL